MQRVGARLGDRDLDERREARRALLELFELPAFLPYRSDRMLKRLPEAERGEWRAFWVTLRRELGKARPLK